VLQIISTEIPAYGIFNVSRPEAVIDISLTKKTLDNRHIQQQLTTWSSETINYEIDLTTLPFSCRQITHKQDTQTCFCALVTLTLTFYSSHWHKNKRTY